MEDEKKNQERRPLWAEFLRIYDEHLSERLAELVSNEKFVRGLQMVLATSEEFRRLVLKGIEVALANLELPTGRDFARLFERLGELDDSFFEVRSTVHELRRSIEKETAELKERIFELELKLERLEQRLDDLTEQSQPKQTKTSTSSKKRQSKRKESAK